MSGEHEWWAHIMRVNDCVISQIFKVPKEKIISRSTDCISMEVYCHVGLYWIVYEYFSNYLVE